MASPPVCIKLHNIKIVKIKYDGMLYEIATSNYDNLLTDFQKHKPEVKQLLYVRPFTSEDFDKLTDDSVLYASDDVICTTSSSKDIDVSTGQHDGGKSRRKSDQNGYNTSLSTSSQDVSKLRSDLSMVDTYCSPPSLFIDAPCDNTPIDTVNIAKRIREVLEKHKISQTLFSKYVIKRSQGTTSDLLRCPKQWERMSEDGKVPYRRMKAWLEGDLQYNLQVLLRIKQGLDQVPMSPFRCNRTRFTEEQKDALETFIADNPRVHHEKLEQFARDHHLTISSVRNWVNNHKQRMKRDASTSVDDAPVKYIKIDSSEGELVGVRGQNFETSGIAEEVPTMLSDFQGRLSNDQFDATTVTAEFDESCYNEVNSPVDSVVDIVTTLKQEEKGQKQSCDYQSTSNLI